jgi:cob(I)alamin adenosyltransferase
VKVYTRRGDSGYTFSPFTGKLVPKDDPCIEFLGDLDEAEAWLGLASTLLRAGEQPLESVAKILDRVQELLFLIGFHVTGARECVGSKEVNEVEDLIDRMWGDVKETGFILHGGDLGSATVGVARAIVRRAERRLITCLKMLGKLEEERTVIALLNRLSDLLYVLELVVAKVRGSPRRRPKPC